MIVLQLVTKRQFRGAEVFAAELSKQLLQRNHTILFVGLYAPPNSPLEVEGATHIDLITQKPRFFSVALLRKLIQLIKSEQPDIIQANGSDTLKYVALAKLVAKLPPVTYRNISMISVWINSPLKKWWVKTVMNQVDFVTSVGEFARRDFINTLNFPENKIKVISRGIPIQPQSREEGKTILRQRFSHVQYDDPIIIHIGNFSPEKNHRFLLEVMEIIKPINPNVRLLCLGGGVLWDAIDAEIKQRQLENQILLFGFYPQPGKLLAAADLTVLCSTVEGVPGVILEAGSQKIPAVAVNVGGVQEVVWEKQTGYVIEEFNPQLFAEKVLHLLYNNELRSQMGRRAYEVVQQKYDPETNAHTFEQLYNQLMISR